MQLLSLALLGLAAVAQAGSSAFTESLCLTYQGPTSVSSVPKTTKGYTKSFTITVKSTSSKTSTVTPKAQTTTTTVYSTKTSTVTAPQNTDTFSSTTTLYTTSISTVVESGPTITVTSTSTSTHQDTTTVGTSSGYTPLKSALKALSSNYHPVKREPLTAREAEAAPAAATPTQSSVSTPATYPTKIGCYNWVQVITTSTSVVTASKTATTTLKASTSTVTITSYVQTTTTVVPTTAKTTVVSTSTSVISTSYTSTSTTTSVVSESTSVVGPTATAYAVCQDQGNYFHKLNGIPTYLINPIGRQAVYAVDGTITNEVDCCNACQKLGENCAINVFRPNRGCQFLTQDDPAYCQADHYAADFSTGFNKGEVWTLNNGNCGAWRYDYANSAGPTICGPGTGRECTCGPGTDFDC